MTTLSSHTNKMFFEENKINEILNCKKCSRRVDEPRVLPCGSTICSTCFSKLQIYNKRFECIVCSQDHLMPDEGLPLSEALFNLLAIEPTEIYRSKSVELLKETLSEIRNQIETIQFGITNGLDKIKEYCLDLRTDVQLVTEQSIQKIYEYNETLVKEISAYEQECMNEFTVKKFIKEEFDIIIKELESFYTKWNEYLTQVKIEDEAIFEANEQAAKLNQKARDAKFKLDNLIFNGNLLKFERAKAREDCLKNCIMGSLKKQNLKSILSDSQMIDLLKLCGFADDFKWNLVYRATEHGFSSAAFHSLCDDKRFSLTIIKSTNGNVFGGYTEQEWSGNGVNKYDPCAFLFSFINKENTPIKIRCFRPNYAIYCKNDYGPTFGAGHDLNIRCNSNINTHSYSNLGFNYAHPQFNFGSNEAKAFLAGSYYFKTCEIEVYARE